MAYDGKQYDSSGGGTEIDPAVQLISEVSDDAGGFIQNPDNETYYTAVEQSAKSIYDSATEGIYTKATEDK